MSPEPTAGNDTVRVAPEAGGPTPPAFRLDFARLARLAWEHRADLLRVNLAVAALAAAVVFLLPCWYVSSVTMVPAPQSLMPDLTSDTGGMLAGAAFGLGAGPTPQDELKMVVESRAVADSVIRRHDLVQLWHQKGMETTREKLADHVNLTTPKQGQIVLEVEARTPAMARAMAASYAEFAASEGIRLKRSLATQRRIYLEARLHEIDHEIREASAAVETFEESHRMVALPEQTKETMDAAGAIQAQAALMQTELAAARRYFTEQSPEVAMLRDRLDELNRQVRELETHGGTLLLKGDELPALKQQYLELTREQASLLAVSELLRRVYEQARVEEANPVPTFSVLDAPDLPERHARPKRGLSIAASFALSLAGTLTLLYLRGSLDAITRIARRRRRGGVALAPEPAAPERHAA